MAYGTIIASAPLDAVLAYREKASALLRPSMVIQVSHLLAYWVQIEPLGDVLGQCVDGGEVLAPRLWHPLRPPHLHRPKSVTRLAGELEDAWEHALCQHVDLHDDGFFHPQITKLSELFQHASKYGEAVVSFLDKPSDYARARKVKIPDLRVRRVEKRNWRTTVSDETQQ